MNTVSHRQFESSPDSFDHILRVTDGQIIPIVLQHFESDHDVGNEESLLSDFFELLSKLLAIDVSLPPLRKFATKLGVTECSFV
jgi:hypothetical protein